MDEVDVEGEEKPAALLKVTNEVRCQLCVIFRIPYEYVYVPAE